MQFMLFYPDALPEKQASGIPEGARRATSVSVEIKDERLREDPEPLIIIIIINLLIISILYYMILLYARAAPRHAPAGATSAGPSR